VEALLTGLHDILPGLDSACRLWLQQKTFQFKGGHRNKNNSGILLFSKVRTGHPPAEEPLPSLFIHGGANAARKLCSNTQLVHKPVR